MDNQSIKIRKATLEDLQQIVGLLAEDPIASSRESMNPQDLCIYQKAFQEIQEDPNHEIMVADISGTVIGVLQLSYLIHLSRKGARRAQIEGVRVSKNSRGQGVGKKLIQEAIDRAKSKGCQLVQLTSDKARDDAINFYRSMGFIASHEGFKLRLSNS